MTEILHRKEIEFSMKEKSQLKLSVVRGLRRVTKSPLIFSGFTSAAIQNDEYRYPYYSIWAVDEKDWDLAIKHYDDYEDPLYYADARSYQSGTSPAVGAYDSTLLREADDGANTYMAVPGGSITAACLRVVVWDLHD